MSMTASHPAAPPHIEHPLLKFFGKTCACAGLAAAILIPALMLAWAAMYVLN